MNFYKYSSVVTNNKSIITFIRHRSKTSSEYCVDLVKQYDYENFMCTILLQKVARLNAFSVRGFNVEISRIADQVSVESIGLMRMKFWEDTLEKCLSGDSKQVPKHPVAIELYKGFANLEALEKYSEQTVSNVYYLILEGCNVKNVNADHAASHLGKAQGIVQHLRSIPLAKKLDLISIPQEILIKNNMSQEDVLRGKCKLKLNDCVFEVASRAHQHLTKSRNLINDVPHEARSALLPAVTVTSYLEKLQQVDYDVFHPNLQQRNFRWHIQLWWNNFKRKY